MLLSLAPNPAIDRILIVPGFRHADVCRVNERIDTAGGKGFNVVRVARTLGLPVHGCAPLGGETGRQIAALADAEGLAGSWHWLSQGESRICLLVTDPAARDHLTINEPGPRVEAADWREWMQLVWHCARTATLFASSGSVPLGISPGQYLELLHGLPRGLPICIDTSGATLAVALDQPVDLLKINGHEIGAVLGREIATPRQARDAAAEVIRRGPKTVVVTLGAQGAVAVDAASAWWARPPAIDPISPVGSGDATLAGIIAVLHEQGSLAEALRTGVACGAANTLSIGAGRMLLDDMLRLRAATEVVPLPE